MGHAQQQQQQLGLGAQSLNKEAEPPAAAVVQAHAGGSCQPPPALSGLIYTAWRVPYNQAATYLPTYMRTRHITLHGMQQVHVRVLPYPSLASASRGAREAQVRACAEALRILSTLYMSHTCVLPRRVRLTRSTRLLA